MTNASENVGVRHGRGTGVPDPVDVHVGTRIGRGGCCLA